MTLAASIDLPVSPVRRWAMWTIVLGGSALVLLTVVQRGQFQLSNTALIGLFGLSALAWLIFRRDDDSEADRYWEITEEGYLRVINTSTIKTSYRLGQGSVYWPGVFFLRLEAVSENLDDGAAWSQSQSLRHELIKPVLRLVWTRDLSASSRWALARLFLWSQRKGLPASSTIIDHNRSQNEESAAQLL